MKCSKFRRLLIPYSEGSLPAEKALSMERHLALCEECSRELRSVTCTADALRQAEYPGLEPAADLRSRVLAQIADERVRKPGRRPAGLQTYSAAMAGLLLVAVAGAGMWSMLRRGVEAPTAKLYERIETPAGPQSEKAREPAATLPAERPVSPESKSADKPTAKRVASSDRVPNPTGPMRAPGYMRVGENLQWHKDEGRVRVGEAPASASPGGVVARSPELHDISSGRFAASAPTREPSEQITNNLKQSPLGGAQSTAWGMTGDAKEGAASAGGYGAASPGAASASRGEQYFDESRGVRPDIRYGMGNTTTSPDGISAQGLDRLEAGVAYYPTSVTAIVNLMDEYRRAGRPRDEYRLAQHLTRLDPDNANHWLARAQAADRVPMPRTAEACYRRAIKLGLKNPQLEQAQERVKALKGE
ncbi:MAG: zf-HC2 domain-containing protein [Armatimonadetes bacterium]|nr:zf-HC2 domain-containing protein [Armatimonadota bacterium]